MSLSHRESATLARVADALFTPWRGTRPASETGTAERAAELAARLDDEEDRRALHLLLRLLDAPVVGAILHGRARAFTSLSPTEAERALLGMAGGHALGRRAFKVLHGLIVTALLSGEGADPLTQAMGYPGPLAPPPERPRRLKPIEVTRASRWTADIVVVGSGAGGGVAAAVLAEAGLDVVVLERGAHLSERDFTHRQWDADAHLLEQRLTRDLGVTVIAGRCLGGGTLVNYSTALRAPAPVLREWDRVAGFHAVFEGEELARSFDAVARRIGVTTEESRPWARDRLLERAMEQLGWDVSVLPRNVRGCAADAQCGFCGFGCRLGAKQSGLRTWLFDATRAGARVVAGAEVLRVERRRGRAVGVLARVGSSELSVGAKAVVVACGAIHTPLLLARSGIAGPAIGEGLALHPATGMWGRFDEPVDPWGGVMQARLSEEHADLDGRGYGVRFESAPVHPVGFAATHGWGGGADFARLLESYRHWAPFGVLVRDRSRGRIEASAGGAPRIHYALGETDRRHVREGMHRAAEALAAAGAREVRAIASAPIAWRPASGEPLDKFIGRLEAHGLGACRTTYGSLHQMGTARMGSDAARGAVGEANEVHGVPGLYVMDASCFPTPSGVNPALTVHAIAHRAARALAGELA